MDLGSISAAAIAVKDIYNGVRALDELQDNIAAAQQRSALLDLVIRAQHLLIDAQAQHAAAIGRVNELEAKMKQAERWANQKARYQLHRLPSGTLVYRYQPAENEAEPVHDLCPNCYLKDVPSILQAAGFANGHQTASCPNCRAVYLLGKVTGFFDIN